MTDIVERLNDSLSAGYSELRKEAAVEIMRLRAKIAEMERQEPIGGMLEVSPHNYELMWYRPVPFGAKLYTLPGAQAQPAPSVPREAINKMLTQLMDIAVSNGANSVSMSDEQIQDLLRVGNPSAEECRLIRMGWDAAMRTLRAPEGWKLVPVDPTLSMLTAAILSSHAINVHRAEHCYRAMIAAAPEAKP